MEYNEKISIVVPIYNVEEYLSRCLDSIVAQTYHNIEVLLIDDGSPDNSGMICDEYAAKDSRIRVFHIPNGGVARARQYGVENSTGEYIVFVDPDDWLPLDSLETLLKAMTSEIDIVIGGYIASVGDNESCCILKNEVIDQDIYIKKLLQGEFIYGSPWAKLYRSNLFLSEDFPNLRKSQDFLMNLQIAFKCRNIQIIDSNTYYYYYMRNSSTTNKFVVDVNYAKQFVNKTQQYLIANDKFDFHRNSYYEFALLWLRTTINNGNYVSPTDIWVKTILDNTAKGQISVKGQITSFIIRCRLLQKLFYICNKRFLKYI